MSRKDTIIREYNRLSDCLNVKETEIDPYAVMEIKARMARLIDKLVEIEREME
jgi:hypothetical protein